MSDRNIPSKPMSLPAFIELISEPIHLEPWMRQYVIDALNDLLTRLDDEHLSLQVASEFIRDVSEALHGVRPGQEDIVNLLELAKSVKERLAAETPAPRTTLDGQERGMFQVPRTALFAWDAPCDPEEYFLVQVLRPAYPRSPEKTAGA